MKFSFVNAGVNETLAMREKSLSTASFPPLGILYMATILRKRGIDVSVLDQAAKGLTIEQTVEWVKKENPDILGFSTFSSSGRTAALISAEAKRYNPNVIIVFGGYYATFNPERILTKYPYVDIIARGEGEDTVIDLVECLEGRRSLKDVRGITFRDANRIVSTPDRPLIKDLNSLEFPDRSLIDVEYHSTVVGANAAAKRFTSIASSRGCVYKCRFCSCQKFAHSIWRPRSVENTVDELHYLTGEGYRQFTFVDDSFTLNQKRVVELCRSIRKERLDIEFFCEGRVDSSSHEMFGELAKAGCRVMYFGIESANQRILDYYRKNITPDQSRSAVLSARRAGIDVIVGSFVVGAPDETREEIYNTIEFAKHLSIDLPQINILCAYPGMDLWDELKTKGFLNEEKHWEIGAAISAICPTAVPLEEIKRIIHHSLYSFLRRPDFILRQMVRTMRSSYRKEVIANNIIQIGNIMENFRNFA